MPPNNALLNEPPAKAVTAVAPGTTSTLVLAANASRKVALIYNAGTVTVFLGGPTAAVVATGVALAAGASLTDNFSDDAWYGITASGTGDLRVVEVS